MNYRLLDCQIISVLLLFSLIGCSSSKEILDLDADSTHAENLEVTDVIKPDEEMANYLEPYAAPVREKMDHVLTVSEGSFTVSQPEGALGNLAADIIRSRATYEMRARVDIAIMNNDRLRTPLLEGEITVGHIFEMMPFANHITVLRFSGSQILDIADEIAEKGGGPVSGMRMRIQDGKARDVLIGHRQVNPGRDYWVATTDWMANGGGDMPTLWYPLERVDHELLARDAILDYLSNKSAIQPKIDYRLR
ncbi:MAG: 5'-nucleotidase C-terminal domain-containing protein [Balneolales bacterium]